MTAHDDFEIRVSISSVEDVVEARQQGRTLAAALGFSPSEATLIAAAISELARNIVTYAGEGEISIGRTSDSSLLLVARDRGPGIADVETAMRSGYSTSGGLGLGLAGVRRIADHFAIESNSTGTTVTLVKARR